MFSAGSLLAAEGEGLDGEAGPEMLLHTQCAVPLPRPGQYENAVANLDGEGGSAGHVSGVERPVCVERHGVHSEKEEGNADKQGELAQQVNTMLG